MKTYSQTIDSRHRTAFVILLDRSGSMAEHIDFNGREASKAEALAEVANRLVFELLCRARRGDRVKDYFDLALLGYSGDEIVPLFGDCRGFIPITEFAERADSAPFELPQWIVPAAEGQTPMIEALREACELVGKWCSCPENVESYQPTVFNITDGEASDGDEADLREAAERLRRISTADGNVLLVNIHLAGTPTQRSIVFPASGEELGDNFYGRLLYECSSVMPANYASAIAALRGDRIVGEYRGMSYNAAIGEVIAMMNIGSISLNVI